MKRTTRAVANASKRVKTGSSKHAAATATEAIACNGDKRVSKRGSRKVSADKDPVTAVQSSSSAGHLCKDAGKVVARKPPKFSWVVEGLLAGQGRPTLHGHVKYLCDNGFKYIVTLTVNKPRALQEYPGTGLDWVHIPINDEQPPSIEQIQTLVDTVERAKTTQSAVAVHCAWGRGRTGTMLACYLAHSKDLSAEAAIDEIRKLRPGSIDTDQQIQAVRTWVNHSGQSS